MSVQQLKTLARKHWAEWLPDKFKKLQAQGRLNEALQGAADLAQMEIEHLMKQGYPEHAAREVALPQFILLNPEDHPDELDEELAEKERAYQKYMAEPNEEPLPTSAPPKDRPGSKAQALSQPLSANMSPTDQKALQRWKGMMATTDRHQQEAADEALAKTQAKTKTA